jgi:hypothetical protein
VQAQAQAQLEQTKVQAQIIETGANNYVVKIGEETQEKSGLKPQMSEDELIRFLNKPSDKKSKKSKKSK